MIRDFEHKHVKLTEVNNYKATLPVGQKVSIQRDLHVSIHEPTRLPVRRCLGLLFLSCKVTDAAVEPQTPVQTH